MRQILTKANLDKTSLNGSIKTNHPYFGALELFLNGFEQLGPRRPDHTTDKDI